MALLLQLENSIFVRVGDPDLPYKGWAQTLDGNAFFFMDLFLLIHTNLAITSQLLDRVNQYHEKTVAVTGMFSEVPEETSGKILSQKNVPESHNALSSKISGTGRQTCLEHWVDTCPDLVQTFCTGRFRNQPLQSS